MAIDDEYRIKLGREYYSKYQNITKYIEEKNLVVDITTVFGYTFIVFENKKDMVTFKMEYL